MFRIAYTHGHDDMSGCLYRDIYVAGFSSTQPVV